jgi:hypothetical protein
MVFDGSKPYNKCIEMDRNGTSMLPERGLMVVNHTWF